MTTFKNLTPREQILLLGGGAVLIVIGIWLYVWQPLTAERAQQADRIARYLTIIEIAETADNTQPRAPVVASPTTSLAPRVTQSAEAAGIQIARLDPDDPRLRLTVVKASFVEITSWIAMLEANDGIRAVAVEMSRQTEPGQVSVRMTVEDTQ